MGFNRGAQFLPVAAAADLVENDTGNVRRLIKGLIPQQQWRNAPSHAFCVNYQDNRCCQLFGQFGI